MKKIIFLIIPTILFLSGCADIATKDDIDSLKEKISNVEDDLYGTVKQVAEKFQAVETDYNQKIEKLNKDIKEVSDKILVLNEEISGLKNEIKEIKGKIDEVIFEYNEKIKKMADENIEKNLEIKREIENLKKVYNDLIVTTSTLNKNLSSIQTDMLNLKESQTKISEISKNFSQNLELLNEKIDKINKRVEENIKVLLDEITRQESEIYNLKKQISSIEKTPTILKSEKEKYYVVQKGDYLIKIAKKFNTTPEAIKKANNLKKDTIYPGQKLLIP